MAMSVTAAPLFAALLTPHRSLTPTGMRILLGGFAGLSCALGAGFWVIGAWPVVGFLGLDVLLLYLALKLSFVSARRSERLELTHEALTVRRVDAWGRASDDRLAPPHWLKVEIDDPVRHESQLRLSTHGRSVTVGSFLMAPERLDLAKALRAAIARLSI
jgi:uncharacterized membrane protein